MCTSRIIECPTANGKKNLEIPVSPLQCNQPLIHELAFFVIGFNHISEGVDSTKREVDMRVQTNGNLFRHENLTSSVFGPAFKVADDTRYVADLPTVWTFDRLASTEVLGCLSTIY